MLRRASVGRLAWLLAAAQMLAYVDRFLLAAVAPLVQARFGLTDARLGILLGPALAVPYGIVVILSGRQVDRWPVRPFVIGGVVMGTVAAIVMGVGQSFGGILAGRAMLGIGQAAFMPAAIATLLACTAKSERARALSILTSGSALGRSAGVLVGGAILGGAAALGIAAVPLGWRLVFLIGVLPNLLVLAMLMRWLPRTKAVPARKGALGLVSPAVAIHLAGSIAPILIGQSVAAWLPAIIVRGYGLTAAAAATLAGMATLVAAPLGQLLGGTLTERTRMQPATLAVSALAVATAALAIVCTVASVPLLVAGIVGFNLAAGVASFTYLFGLQPLVPTARRGSANGLFMALVTLVGAGAGPLLTGVLSDATTGLGPALMTVSGIALVLAAAAAFANRIRYACTVARVREKEAV